MRERVQSEGAGQGVYRLKRAVLASSLVLGVALVGAAGCKDKQSPGAQNTATHRPSSAPEATASYIPVPNGGSPTALEAYLGAGYCNIAVAIWGETDRQSAESYIAANGQPTAQCPKPNVNIRVTCGPVRTGEVIGSNPARILIRYAFMGGDCTSPEAPPITSIPERTPPRITSNPSIL